MTNQDLKQELIVIKESLYSLQEITKHSGIDVIDINSFIDLVTCRFVDFESELISTLNQAEVYQVMKEDGPEAAKLLIDKLFTEQ